MWQKNNITWQDAFNSVSIKDKIIDDRALKINLKNLEVHYRKAKALTDLCQLPKDGEQYRIVTEKQFNAFAAILAILEKEDINEMSLAIYRINQPSVESLIEFIDGGRIKQANFLISNFFNQTKKPEMWAIRLRDYSETKENVTFAYVHNHAKVLCAKTKENHYVFEGSGNMSDNARIEQYLFENNRDSYEFHSAWIKDICNGVR